MSKTYVQLALIAILYVIFFSLIYLMAISGEPLLQKLNVLPAALDGDAYRESFRNSRLRPSRNRRKSRASPPSLAAWRS